MIRSLRLTLAVCLAIAFLLPRPARAQGQVVHVVQTGENLYRIGLKYGVGWPEIMQANGLSSTTIYVGQQLVIPVPGGAPASPPADLAPAPTLAAVHTVAPGETLLSIAVRYGVSWPALAQVNGLTNPNLIFPGQRLIIPGAGALRPVAPDPPTGLAGKRIVVDVSEQHLYAYQGEALIFSFVASTGLPGLDTWPGTYRVQSKIENAYGGNWDIWMPFWLGIYWAGSLENGIHALPILPGGGRLWEGYLGQPISYGCVVLGTWEAQQLWNWAEIGDAVIVQP